MDRSTDGVATRVGVLGPGALASVSGHGAVRGIALAEAGVIIDWWVGADDRWHVPAEEATTRRHRPFAAPIVETSVRIPGGEAVERVYGATVGAAPAVVVEIENRSPAPFTAAIVVQIAGRRSVEIDGATLLVDGEVALVFPRPPGAWAAGDSTREIIMSGGAVTAPFEARRGPVEVALLFPIAHRTTLRAVLAAEPVDVRSAPTADAVARGWDRQLERGLQAVIPAPIGERVEAARSDLLLADRRDPAVVVALEDWGFDSEAADGWARLGVAGRRRAHKRVAPVDPWGAIKHADAGLDPAAFLTSLRTALVGERAGIIDLLPGFPPDWLGQSVTVDAVPLRSGSLSFAVRWHGARPALLWDAPGGVELRAPVLDSDWSSNAPAGEALLVEPSTSLLPMGARDRSAGAPIDAPGQFS